MYYRTTLGKSLKSVIDFAGRREIFCCSSFILITEHFQNRNKFFQFQELMISQSTVQLQYILRF